MKKNVGKIFFLSVALFALIFSSCASSAKAELEPVVFDKLESRAGEITLVTDPAKEVMAMLLRLADDPMLTYPFYGNSDFVVAVDTWFTKFKNHPSVKTVKNMKKTISTDDFFSITNIMKDDLTGFNEPVKPYEFMVNDVWNEKNAQEILVAMNRFAIDTKFDKFYLLNRSLYISMHNGVADCLSDGLIEKFISEFYLSGKSVQLEFHISELLSQMFGWYGNGKEVLNGKRYVMTLPPYWDKNNYLNLFLWSCRPIVNPMLTSIPEDYFEEYKACMNEIYKIQGLPEVTGYSHKLAALTDIISLNLLIFLRENDRTEEYEQLKTGLTAMITEETFQELETEMDKYLEKVPSDRNFEKNLLIFEADWCLDYLKKTVKLYVVNAK